MPVQAKEKSLSSIWSRLSGEGVIMAVGYGLITFFHLIKDMIIAYQYGMSPDLDMYFIVFAYVYFISHVCGMSVRNAIVPLMSEAYAKGDKAVYSNVIVYGCKIGFRCTSIILFLFFIPMLIPGFSELIFHKGSSANLSLILLVILLATLVNSALQTMYALFFSRKSYVVFISTQIFTPILFTSLLLGVTATRDYLFLMIVSTVVIFAEFILVLALTNRMIGSSTEQAPKGLISKNSLFLLIANSLLICFEVFDRTVASQFQAGDVSMITYASKIPSAFYNLAGMAVGLTFLPSLSVLISEGKYSIIHNLLRKSYLIFFLIGLLIALPLFVLSNEIIILVFQRGEFTLEEAMHVGELQSFYALSIPIFYLTIAPSRYLLATKSMKFYLIVSVLSVIAKCVACFIGVYFISLYAIPISTFCAYFCMLLLLVFLSNYDMACRRT